MVLSGPTGVGAAKLLSDNDAGTTLNDYNAEVVTENGQIQTALTSGEVDIAAIATNVAANLAAQSDGSIQMLAVYRSTVPMVIVTLMVLPVVWSNVKQGIGQADRQLLELGRAYRFSRWKKVKLIYLPSIQPYFLSAVTTGMGLAWKSGVAAEVLCTPRQAIGTEVYNAKFYLEIPTLFAWTAVVVALSLTMEWLLAAAVRRWKGGASHAGH